VPLFSEDVRNTDLLVAPLLLEGLLDSALHFDVFVGVGSIDGIDVDLAAGQVSAAGLGSLLDDGLIFELPLGSEVVGEHVVAQVLQEVLLEQHLVELSHRIAEQLSRSRRTIFSS
jgi:hypothetical protein